jgi:hypothetical protein
MSLRPALGKTRAQLRPALSMGERLSDRRGWSTARGGDHTGTTSYSFAPCWTGARAITGIHVSDGSLPGPRSGRLAVGAGAKHAHRCAIATIRRPETTQGTGARVGYRNVLGKAKHGMQRDRDWQVAKIFPNRGRKIAQGPPFAPGYTVSYSCQFSASHFAEASPRRRYRRWYSCCSRSWSRSDSSSPC